MDEIKLMPEGLEHYSEKHSTPESPLMAKLNRETYLKVLQPHMLSGHLQGNFLKLLSQLMSPKNILEIGTYTGYSALALAEGLQPDGTLYTIDIDEENGEMAQEYFAESPFGSQIKFLLGKAVEVVPTLDVTFDLAFIDADKKVYGQYFDLVIDKVRPGGLIIGDNVLWKGKILKPEDEMDRQTKVLHEFNQKIQDDPRVENLLLPLRDGLMIARKR